LASLLDGFTLVVLIPLLKHLFGTAGQLRPGSTRLEELMDKLVARARQVEGVQGVENLTHLPSEATQSS